MKYEYKKDKLPQPVVKGHEEWVELYDVAWKMAFDNVEYITKEGWKPQLTCMPGVGITWQWDSCIMTFITNYSNGTLSAFNNLDNLYRLRRESDGFMAMAYNIEKEIEEYPGRINPPLMAWAEWEHYRVTGDSSRFEAVLPALEGCYQFIENHRRRNTGLYWFEDSGSSGMDNAPRGGYESEYLNGSDLCYIDLGCQQALSAKHLALICGLLGNEEKKAFYESEHKRICDLINKYHWSEKAGFYFDFFSRSDPNAKVKYLNTKTGASFWTLLSGVAKDNRLEKMIAHMFNENEFYTPVPFATLSKDDPNYDATGGYWLGSVWPPTNFAAIRGLEECGRHTLAREAAVKFLSAMCKVYKDEIYGSIWECYAPEAARPATTEAGSIVRSHFVGWGGLAPITMLIEDIIGLNFNALDQTVTFSLFPDQLAGLKNMQFCGGKVSVECTHYEPIKDKSIVEVETDVPFKLVVKTNYRWDKVAEISVGKNTIYV